MHDPIESTPSTDVLCGKTPDGVLTLFPSDYYVRCVTADHRLWQTRLGETLVFSPYIYGYFLRKQSVGFGVGMSGLLIKSVYFPSPEVTLTLVKFNEARP